MLITECSEETESGYKRKITYIYKTYVRIIQWRLDFLLPHHLIYLVNFSQFHVVFNQDIRVIILVALICQEKARITFTHTYIYIYIYTHKYVSHNSYFGGMPSSVIGKISRQFWVFFCFLKYSNPNLDIANECRMSMWCDNECTVFPRHIRISPGLSSKYYHIHILENNQIGKNCWSANKDFIKYYPKDQYGLGRKHHKTN